MEGMTQREIENGIKVFAMIRAFYVKHKGHKITDTYLHRPNYLRIDYICHDCAERVRIVYRGRQHL